MSQYLMGIRMNSFEVGLERTTMQRHDFVLIMVLSQDDGSDSISNGFKLKLVHTPFHRRGDSCLVRPISVTFFLSAWPQALRTSRPLWMTNIRG